jgi:hypothetical protein
MALISLSYPLAADDSVAELEGDAVGDGIISTLCGIGRSVFLFVC